MDGNRWNCGDTMVETAFCQSRFSSRVGRKILLAALSMAAFWTLAPAGELQARDREILEDPPVVDVLNFEAVGDWIRQRFSAEEFAALPPEQLNIEPHFCSCEDRPNPHYPYRMVLFNTPKGDLVARAEVHEHSAKFTPLAVRNGEEYCEVGAEDNCYGSFSSPCQFTDFRFGDYLENFFPSCK